MKLPPYTCTPVASLFVRIRTYARAPFHTKKTNSKNKIMNYHSFIILQIAIQLCIFSFVCSCVATAATAASVSATLSTVCKMMKWSIIGEITATQNICQMLWAYRFLCQFITVLLITTISEWIIFQRDAYSYRKMFCSFFVVVIISETALDKIWKFWLSRDLCHFFIMCLPNHLYRNKYFILLVRKIISWAKIKQENSQQLGHFTIYYVLIRIRYFHSFSIWCF